MTIKLNEEITKSNKVITYLDGTVEEKIVNPSVPTTKKKDNNHFVNLYTGEVKEFRKHITKRDSLKSVSSKMIASRELIYNSACMYVPNVWFVTLTFKAPVTDYGVAESHFKRFIRKLKRKHPKMRYGVWRQIQLERKTWHFHLVVWSPEDINLNSEKLKEHWINGTRHTSRIETTKDLNKILFYLTNYDNWSSNKKVQKRIKTLEYMDPGLRLFSSSQGLEMPKFRYENERKKDSRRILFASRRTCEFNGETIEACIIKDSA